MQNTYRLTQPEICAAAHAYLLDKGMIPAGAIVQKVAAQKDDGRSYGQTADSIEISVSYTVPNTPTPPPA